MKDLIAKLQLDANCALGAIWMHIEAQAARIAELEAQIAASADTDKLREAIANISNNQITEAWESCGGVDGFYKSFGYQQFAHAILDLAADTVSSTALQAPVREVPEGWKLTRCEDGTIIVSKNNIGGYAAWKDDSNIASSILYHFADEFLATVPAAPVQPEGE